MLLHEIFAPIAATGFEGSFHRDLVAKPLGPALDGPRLIAPRCLRVAPHRLDRPQGAQASAARCLGPLRQEEAAS